MTIDTEAAARAVLVHGVIDRSRPDEQDTLDQVEAVGAALRRSGFDTAELALGLDLSPLSALANDPPHWSSIWSRRWRVMGGLFLCRLR